MVTFIWGGGIFHSPRNILNYFFLNIIKNLAEHLLKNR